MTGGAEVEDLLVLEASLVFSCRRKYNEKQPANTLSQAGPAPAFSSSKIPSDYLSSFEMINDTVRQSNDNTTELNHQTIFLSCLTEPSQNPSISTGDPTTTNLSTSPLCFNFDLVLVFFFVFLCQILPRSLSTEVGRKYGVVFSSTDTVFLVVL